MANTYVPRNFLMMYQHHLRELIFPDRQLDVFQHLPVNLSHNLVDTRCTIIGFHVEKSAGNNMLAGFTGKPKVKCQIVNGSNLHGQQLLCMEEVAQIGLTI